MKAVALALLAGCADPVVSLSLRLPANGDQFDVSCATTVEVYTVGKNFPADSTDYITHEIHLDPPPTSWDDLHSKLRTEFDVPIPNSGLQAVELWGWAGDSGFDMPAVAPDMLFNGTENYIGQDTIEIPVVPNLSCAMASVKVRPIDIVKLTLSAQATTTARCTEAAVPDTALDAGIDVGTLSVRPILDSTDFWGGFDGAVLTNGVSTAMARTKVGANSCLAFNAGMDTEYSISCASGAKGVCGLDGEQEAAVLDATIAMNSLASPNKEQYGGAVLVGVWSDNAGVTAPMSGAKIALSNPSAGTVVYVEPDSATAATVTKLTPIANGTATGPNGLALVYTSDLQDLTVTAGNLTKGLRVGVVEGQPSAALVMMN